MDPTTTLFTFMLETHSSVQSVSLVGSWDNFERPYKMERDSRRDPRQWRGCHVFQDVICDGERPGSCRRSGGLKMGQPYYYYYELDGSVETHDPSLPSTSACPYLPGQTVNVMWVPAERSDRKRTASLSSVRNEDFKTMLPQDKYTTLRPAPSLSEMLSTTYRPVTSQAHVRSLKHKRSDRSISPASSWWSPRKLFTRKNSVSSQASSDRHSDDASVRGSSSDGRRSASSSLSEGSRARAMSPDSLRRFLSDDTSSVVMSQTDDAERLFLSIPDDIAEEDDDNFATSAASESGPKTILSPPPPVTRNHSASTLRRPRQNDLVVTLNAPTSLRTESRFKDDQDTPTSRFSFSSDEGSVYGDDKTVATSPETETDAEIPSFYHSEAEEDDQDSDVLSPPATIQSSNSGVADAFKGYRLPRTSMDGNSKATGEYSLPLLAAPAGSVVDDFMSEMSNFQSRWI